MEKLKPNVETFRLRALASLLSKEVDKARLEIKKALELEPRWEIIRFTAATIDYYSALAPVVLPDRFVAWPQPVDWAFVKRDDENLNRLREAVKIFQELAETTFKEKDERQMYESWRLACLVNDPERQEEALEYCKKIIDATPTHYRAIIWAVARNLEVDLKPCESALKTLVTERRAEIPHILALVNCYLKYEKTKKATKLLNDTKIVFATQHEDELWKFWRVRLLVVSGIHKAALNSIDDFGTSAEFREAKTITLYARARQNNDWQPLIQHLETSYKETQNPIFLYECCSLKAQHKDWEYVAERAEVLVNEIGTAEALRIAAISSYNAKKFQLCLELLDNNRKLFGQQRLPNELRRIRVFCQRALGILSEAIAEAETLAREEPTTTHLLDLAQIYYEKGDLKMLAIISRQLAGQPDLPPENSLGIARLLQWEDKKLATSLWRKSATTNLPDSLVSEALALGYQLGLDQEVTPLLTRMQELGHEKRGGVHFATIDDLISLFKQHQQDAVKLGEFYRSGTIPVHMIAERAQRSLADFYHGMLLENESLSKPKNQLYLLARHGGRALIANFPDKKLEWRLNLDITAILLAEHLDVLSLVEEVFKPLRIPQQAIPALLRMRDRFTQHQLSSILSYEQIIDLAARGALRVADYALPLEYENTKLIDELGKDWVAMFENIRASNGYIMVESLPLRNRDRKGMPSALPNNASQHLVNCRGLVEALRQYGPLSDEEYKAALIALGTEGQSTASETIPRKGSLLLCSGNIPEFLARANLLHIVCDHYQVYLAKGEFDRVHNELKQYKQHTKIAEWLGNLIERIRKGIDEGVYQIIPHFYDDNEIIKQLQQTTPEVLCLLTFLQMKAESNDVVCADDRCSNSYAAIGTARSIGINEVLQALVAAGTMELNAYYQKLIKLRAANVLFIPIQKEEILYHLTKASVEDQALVETQELIIFRRYISSCLMHGDILQKPPLPDGAPNKHGEIAFVLNLSHTLIESLIEVWANKEAHDNAIRARSGWLIENLYLDHLALFNVTAMPRAKQDDLYLVAISLAGLMFQAVRLIEPKVGEKVNSSAKNFFGWLFDHVLKKRLDADRQLMPAVADALKKYFQNARKDPLEKYPEDVVIWMFQKLYEVLPEPIRNEIRLDTDFMSSIGYDTLTAVSFGGLNFNPNEFWTAAGEAINGGEATIAPIESDKQIKFQYFTNENGLRTFGFTHSETGQRFVDNDFTVELLLKSPVEREKAIRKNRHWFDCQKTALERLVAEIVSLEDPRRLIEEARSWRDSSATFFYANLENKLYNKLYKQEPFSNSDLLPKSAVGLLRYLRLEHDVNPGAELREALEKSARTIIEDDGIQTALDRLIGLPVPLPVSLISTIAGLSQQNRNALIKRLLKTVGSPISKIHFLSILLHFGDESPACRRLARRLMTNLLSPESAIDFDAYLSIIGWTSEEFGYWKDTRDLSHHLRLALVWTHSHRLYTIFKSLHAPSDWLHEVFSNARQHLPYELFNRNPDYWFDIAHPRRVNWMSFLLSGLAYSLRERTLEYIGGKNIQDRLLVLAFPPNDNIRLPHAQLMIDPTRAHDCLESFLGGDRSERLSSLLSVEVASTLSSSSLRDTAKEAVNILIERKDFFPAWAVLNATLSDLPPYQSLTNELKIIFKQTDFVELYKANLVTGGLAILVASFQVSFIRDEDLRVYLKEQLVKIASYLSVSGNESKKLYPNTIRKDGFGELEDMRVFLLDPALNLALAAKQTDSVIPEFADILTRLVDAWPAMVPIVKRSVQRLYQELPIAQSQQFLQLLVRLRAE